MLVGGADGLRLARAAFAAVLKFSEQLSVFRTIWDEIEMIAMGADQELKGAAKLNVIVKEIHEAKPNEFDLLCRQFEQVSQIRKWTQEMKKDLTESLKKECTDELIAEINEKMKKEKEEKEAKEAEEGEKKDASEEKKPDEESKEEKKEESKEEAKKPDEAPKKEPKEESKEKSKDESKDESKEGDKKDGDKKDDEKKDEDDEKKEDEDEDDSGALFKGPLDASQQEEAEDRAFKKMQKIMVEKIDDAVKKAQLVLKMQIPEAY